SGPHAGGTVAPLKSHGTRPRLRSATVSAWKPASFSANLPPRSGPYPEPAQHPRDRGRIGIQRPEVALVAPGDDAVERREAPSARVVSNWEHRPVRSQQVEIRSQRCGDVGARGDAATPAGAPIMAFALVVGDEQDDVGSARRWRGGGNARPLAESTDRRGPVVPTTPAPPGTRTTER